jgi:sugar fermentation stimulation protein A
MHWPSPLVTGTLLKRYKRFLVDVHLENGDSVTAHCANTGAMLGLPKENAQVWLSLSLNSNRALPYSYEMIAAEGTLVGVNTNHPNALVLEALQAGHIPELRGYDTIKREAPIGKSRLDFKLSKAGLPDCYVEVKNCHLKRTQDMLEPTPNLARPPAKMGVLENQRAVYSSYMSTGSAENTHLQQGIVESRSGFLEFPDGVTKRGAKHLEELMMLKQQGLRAVMLYIGQRNDCRAFRIAADLDPMYAKAFTAAQQAGVEMLCYDCVLTEEGIVLGKALGSVDN